MKRHLIQCLLGVISLWITDVSHATPPQPPIYSEKNTTLVVTQDQPTFTIELSSNPTTGYSWILKKSDTSLLTLISHTFISPDNTHLIGAPGKERWVFEVKPDAFQSSKQTTLEFIYQRPWESASNTTALSFSVLIRKNP